jgi:hypothetical protein
MRVLGLNIRINDIKWEVLHPFDTWSEKIREST